MKLRDQEAYIDKLTSTGRLPAEIRSRKDFIERTLEDLFFVCSYVLRRGKKIEYRDLNHIHRKVCDWLVADPNLQKLLLMSRDSLKSTIGRGGVIQKFLKHSFADDEALLGILTGDEKLSIEHITKIEYEIETNDLIQAFFSGYVPTKRADAEAWNSEQIRWRKVGIDTGSLRKTLTGRHYFGVWNDNLMNEVNSATVDLRKWAVKRWRQAESLIAEGGWEWVFETPWEPDDISGLILDPGGHFDYTKIHRKSPAMFISETGYSVFSCFARNEAGGLNFPEKLDEAYLARKRRKQGSVIYGRMYEGQIMSEDEQVFPPLLVKHFDKLPRFYSRNIVVDCSGTTSVQSTPTAISICEWDPESIMYIDYAEDMKVDVLSLKKKICELYDKSLKEGRGIDQVGIEWEKYGIYVVQELRVLRPDIPLVPLGTLGRTRDDRISPLQGLYESQRVKSRVGLDKYEAQLTGYRRGKKHQETGILDTLAYQLDFQLIPKEVEVPSEEDIRLNEFAKQVARDRQFQPFQPTVAQQIRGMF